MISPPIQSAMFFDDRMHSFVTKSAKRLVGMLFTNHIKRSAKSMDKGVGKCGRLSCKVGTSFSIIGNLSGKLKPMKKLWYISRAQSIDADAIGKEKYI